MPSGKHGAPSQITAFTPNFAHQRRLRRLGLAARRASGEGPAQPSFEIAHEVLGRERAARVSRFAPEVSAYLRKAEQCLRYGNANLAAGLGNDAARNAYLAMFHAAQALIYDRTGRPAKTHHGLNAEFNRLANAETGLDRDLRRALPQVYNLKAVADYETGADAVIPVARASDALEIATKFIGAVAGLIR